MTSIGIYGRNFDEQHNEGVREMFIALKSREVKILIYNEFAEFLHASINMDGINYDTFSKESFLATGSEVLFSIGGDGTLLEAATFVKGSEIPILGINTGRLGFLSGLTLDHFEDNLDLILSNSLPLDERSVLMLETEAKLFGDENFALNEMTVHKKDSQSMINIHAYVDGKYLNTYWADGLLISTPTGSTAYSLSCGGPITLPSSKNLIITPISPHNLNVRPVLISDQSTITLKVEGRGDQYLLSLDSRTVSIPQDAVLTIRKNDFNIRLMRSKNHSFLKTLRTKLHWGLDQRN